VTREAARFCEGLARKGRGHRSLPLVTQLATTGYEHTFTALLTAMNSYRCTNTINNTLLTPFGPGVSVPDRYTALWYCTPPSLAAIGHLQDPPWVPGARPASFGPAKH
jgi:hypothetical protein